MATTSPTYSPLNVSLTDQSAIVRFFPHRDGLITDNWNVTYSNSNFADWSYDHNFGSGTSSHRTVLQDAYVVIDWAGTALWIYGESTGTYYAQVDNGTVLLTTDPTSGLLFSQTNLQYGLHTAVLYVLGGEVSLTAAIVTVGMGETGTVLEMRNISAVDNVSTGTANPTFIGSADEWTVSDLYTNQTGGYPCITTSTYGATLRFTLNETVAFFLYGSDDWAQGLFTVAVTSDVIGATSSVTDNAIQYSPRSTWSQLNVPKYMATGLDRTVTYIVEITNLGANFNLASVLVYDAVTAPSSSSSSLSNGTGAAASQSPSVSLNLTSASSTSLASSTETASLESGARSTRSCTAGAKLRGTVAAAFALLLFTMLA
ncbi:hypothetical protein DAEQUDRAFT_726127 [Daedalea quercina L-15889]|uniref:Uncharacterized protein n=1 Tax=Daedalea quercina L-15889 TaxID=1314783 RepID=A0A165QR51_9APHY|nr:hypothetical protein DAEQUDRAFT_726127 [Daedalea quercina L-15889]